MKTPLENLTDALENEAYISIGIIEDLYSTPKIRLIAEDRYVDAFDLEDMRNEETNELPEVETEFREIPLKLERGDKGELTQTQDEKFFTLKESDFPWEGIISIKGQSIVASSEILDRQTTLEMANLVIPLLSAPYEIVGKAVKQIIKMYDKDPADWLPESWINPEQTSMFVKAPGPEGATETPPGTEGAETVVPTSDVTSPGGAAEQIMKSISGQ